MYLAILEINNSKNHNDRRTLDFVQARLIIKFCTNFTSYWKCRNNTINLDRTLPCSRNINCIWMVLLMYNVLLRFVKSPMRQPISNDMAILRNEEQQQARRLFFLIRGKSRSHPIV